MITLRKITLENRREVFNLEVNEKQGHFVASNLSSIASCYVLATNGGCPLPFAIYADEQMIGFVMIDRKYQNQGYGKLAMEKILEYIRTFPAGHAKYCWMQYEDDNIAAKKLYEGFGFRNNGEVSENEPVTVLKL